MDLFVEKESFGGKGNCPPKPHGSSGGPSNLLLSEKFTWPYAVLPFLQKRPHRFGRIIGRAKKFQFPSPPEDFNGT